MRTLSFISISSHVPIHYVSLLWRRCLLIARSWLKRLRVFQHSTVNECGLLTPSRATVCIQNTRMPSPLKWEGFICQSFHWCCSNDQVCWWWMVWPFPPPYNQVVLVDSQDSICGCLPSMVRHTTASLRIQFNIGHSRTGRTQVNPLTTNHPHLYIYLHWNPSGL